MTHRRFSTTWLTKLFAKSPEPPLKTMSLVCDHIKWDFQAKSSCDTSACFPWLRTREHIYTFCSSTLREITQHNIAQVTLHHNNKPRGRFPSHLSWGWLAYRLFLYFPWLGLRMRQNMVVICWKRDLWTWSDRRNIKYASIFQPIEINKKGQSLQVDRTMNDNTIWFMPYIKAMILSALFYTQDWNHKTHMPAHKCPQKTR